MTVGNDGFLDKCGQPKDDDDDDDELINDLLTPNL